MFINSTSYPKNKKQPISVGTPQCARALPIRHARIARSYRTAALMRLSCTYPTLVLRLSYAYPTLTLRTPPPPCAYLCAGHLATEALPCTATEVLERRLEKQNFFNLHSHT